MSLTLCLSRMDMRSLSLRLVLLPVVPENEGSPRKRLQRPTHASVYAPFSLRQIVEFILLLPLNLVPWAGVPLFLWLTGYRAGPLQQYRYFVLRGFTKKEKKVFVRERRRQYTGFGVVALVLQLVPVVSMMFLLTSAAGSALWAVRLEEERGNGPTRDEEEQGGGRVDRNIDAEPPPAYEEYEDGPL